MSETLLSIQDLRVNFSGRRGRVQAVRGVNIDILRGQTVGMVGESGSGKSVTALAIMGLLPAGADVVGGAIHYEGQDVLALDDTQRRDLRGSRIAMIFQDPLSSLNPAMPVGRQISEMLERHERVSQRDGLRRAVELLDHVGLPDSARRANSYPHQLSGGQRQRAMIAMAVACRPALLIADEPTSALDVTVQAQVLDLLRRLQAETGMAILLITHDMGLVAGLTDRVAVMYAGRIVEIGLASDLLASPRHPYSVGLIRSVPRLDRPKDARLYQIDGAPPDVRTDIVGCSFRERCDWAIDRCLDERPPLDATSHGTSAACWVLPFDQASTSDGR